MNPQGGFRGCIAQVPLRYNRERRCKNPSNAATLRHGMEDRMSVTTSSHAIVGTPSDRFAAVVTTASWAGLWWLRYETGYQGALRPLDLLPADARLWMGVLLYMTFWVVLTRSGEDSSIIQRIFLNRREAQFVLVAFIFTLLLLIALETTGVDVTHGFDCPCY